MGRPYRLTVRHGSDVERRRFGDLDETIAELRRRAEEIRAEGPLEDVSMIRDYDSEVQVAARLEISTGGPLRGTDAGVDVMGDGRLVPYRGGIFRKELETSSDESPFAVVRAALR